ncbi:MAG TPA: hypothetical protein GX707_09395 [Epulopiscium sp.]|nr:hypothetical protein [Candidatus Epulonipiscium sp.]
MNIGIFYDPRIPYEGTRPNQEVIKQISQYAQIIDLNNYTEKLKEQYDTLINLHGKYFIKETWGAIKHHLKRGGGLINVGDGSPFSKPVSYKNGEWMCEREQTAYHEEIKIFQAPVVDKERISFLKVNEDMPVLKGFEDCFRIKDTVGYVVSFAKGKENQDESGSCGSIDAVLYPLLDGFLSISKQIALFGAIKG